MSKRAGEPVAFLTLENGKDLIVSFAIDLGESGDVASLTLLRTPAYDVLLPEHERGVSIADDDHPEWEDDLLVKLRLNEHAVEMETTRGEYLLDVSRVDPEELRRARRILKKMNFDGRFELYLD